MAVVCTCEDNARHRAGGHTDESAERGIPGSCISPYPFSRVTHLASGTHRSWRSWETLELKIKSGQSSKMQPQATRGARLSR